MSAGSYRFEFSNGEGCYSELSGKRWDARIHIRFTVWAALRYNILPEAGVPTFKDVEDLKNGGGGKRYKLFAGTKEKNEGSVEVTIT